MRVAPRLCDYCPIWWCFTSSYHLPPPLQPLLTEEELAETKRQVEEFGQPGGVGELLHRKLQERAASKENWVHHLTFHLMTPCIYCMHRSLSVLLHVFLRLACWVVVAGGLSWLATTCTCSCKSWHCLPSKTHLWHGVVPQVRFRPIHISTVLGALDKLCVFPADELISSKQRCPGIAYISCLAPPDMFFFMYVHVYPTAEWQLNMLW